jgi:hypothetical protein
MPMAGVVEARPHRGVPQLFGGMFISTATAICLPTTQAIFGLFLNNFES